MTIKCYDITMIFKKEHRKIYAIASIGLVSLYIFAYQIYSLDKINTYQLNGIVTKFNKTTHSQTYAGKFRVLQPQKTFVQYSIDFQLNGQNIEGEYNSDLPLEINSIVNCIVQVRTKSIDKDQKVTVDKCEISK